MSRLNKLEFGNKKRTLFSIAILHSKKFRESRAKTKKGRLLYNKELKTAKRKIKQYKIVLTKPLPRPL